MLLHVWSYDFDEMTLSTEKQRHLMVHECLLSCLLSLTDILSYSFLQNYAKKLVNADRASLFLLDTNTNELYARIFDTGPVDDNVPSKEIRFGYTISLNVLMTNFECCAVYSFKKL